MIKHDHLHLNPIIMNHDWRLPYIGMEALWLTKQLKLREKLCEKTLPETEVSSGEGPNWALKLMWLV